MGSSRAAHARTYARTQARSYAHSAQMLRIRFSVNDTAVLHMGQDLLYDVLI